MQNLMKYLREMEPADKNKPVLVPGDPERISGKNVDKVGAICYTPDHITSYRKLAQELGVQPMKRKDWKKTRHGVVYDPLGQPTYDRQWRCVLFRLILKKWGRTDNMCEYSDHYRPCVGRSSLVDQQVSSIISSATPTDTSV